MLGRVVRLVAAPCLHACSARCTTAATPPFTPRRALMYVPGSDARKLAKIPSLGADCVCLDCEAELLQLILANTDSVWRGST